MKNTIRTIIAIATLLALAGTPLRAAPSGGLIQEMQALRAALEELQQEVRNPASQTPPGTIIAFGGQVKDEDKFQEILPGWLLCNGAVIDKEADGGKYAALVEQLGDLWGDGDDSSESTVNLPDLRGLFLRGISGERNDAYKDPDASDRVDTTGTKVGDRVGGVQMDEFKSHRHSWSYNDVSSSAAGDKRLHWDTSDGKSQREDRVDTSFEGGLETRPKNASVAYLIKY